MESGFLIVNAEIEDFRAPLTDSGFENFLHDKQVSMIAAFLSRASEDYANKSRSEEVHKESIYSPYIILPSHH